MAALKALIKALRDPHLNEEEKIEAAIRCARHHHTGFEPLARLTKDLLGEDASDLLIPEGNNRLEWIVRNIVSGLQTDDEEDLFPTCPTETAVGNRLSLSLPLSFSPSSYFLSFSIQKGILRVSHTLMASTINVLGEPE